MAPQVIALAVAIAGAIVLARLAVRPAAADDWTIVPLSRIVDLFALLSLGRDAATLVAVAGAVTYAIAGSRRPRRWMRAAGTIATVTAATQAAGFAHAALGGTLGHFAWPMQGLPIASAILIYCAVIALSEEVVTPLVAKRSLNRAWSTRLLDGCSNYAIAAAVAVASVEIIDRRLWAVLPVVAVPFALGYRIYAAYVSRKDDEHRRGEIIDAVEHGMMVVDGDCRVLQWDDSVARMLACPRALAIGRPAAEAVPALAKTIVPAAIRTALKNGAAKTLTQVSVDARVFDVRILPVLGAATLLWQDVTERSRAEQAIKRSEERLALAAEGANDGLWEWDRRTQEWYRSGRWNAVIGLPETASTGRVEEWMERVHPDDLAALQAALDAPAGVVSHEHRIRHQDGSYRKVLCRGVAVRNTGRRVVRVAGSMTDITERAIAQQQLRTAGVLDPLTGLSNRADFVERLGQRLDELKHNPGRTRFAALYLDLDRFKIVNDSLGHLVGDELLKAVSRRLESCLRDGDALARLGGDEFAILLNGLHGEEQANAIAFRIQKALSGSFSIGGREVFTSASIGIAFGRAQHTSPDEIMREADRAMYHAKASGKARHELFDADMHARTLDRIGLESDLRRAVDQNDFELHYQPIVLLSTGMCVGFESLIRWTRNGEPISPATFIPMAEELGLIEPVGTWCLQQACAKFAEWKRRFAGGSLEYITVNVSSRQLVQQNFLSLVERTVEESGLKPWDLRLEITETALMDSPTAAARLLQDLREFGVKIYLDDFGTGYSSLSHLHRLPVDALKIDRSFVKSLSLPDRPLIVESILALARTMNTSVVAEGIETDVQAHELERLGCTHAQGYLFSRPLPSQAAEQVLAANQPLSPHKGRSVLSFEPKVAASA